MAVVRADSKALAEVQEQRRASGIPAHVRVEELICPLRAANGLPIVVPTAQLASLVALTPQSPAWQPGGSGSPGNSTRSSPSPQPPTAAARAMSTRKPQGGAASKVPQLRLGGSAATGMARSVSFAPQALSKQMARQASPMTIPQVMFQDASVDDRGSGCYDGAMADGRKPTWAACAWTGAFHRFFAAYIPI